MSTGISYADETWNPVVGCAPVSEGCANCYAQGVARRGMCEQHKGLTDDQGRWNGEVNYVSKALDKPFSWKQPKIILTPSMSDYFYDQVAASVWRSAYRVMSGTRLHTYLVLTKRIEEAVRDLDGMDPLPNVVIGVTVENQRRADERLVELARVDGLGWRTWISYEPALSAVNFRFDMPRHGPRHGRRVTTYQPEFLVVGAETGPGARLCNVEWIRSVVDQCKRNHVRCHVKQLSGSNKPEEWPEDLRVREMVKHG